MPTPASPCYGELRQYILDKKINEKDRSLIHLAAVVTLVNLWPLLHHGEAARRHSRRHGAVVVAAPAARCPSSSVPKAAQPPSQCSSALTEIDPAPAAGAERRSSISSPRRRSHLVSGGETGHGAVVVAAARSVSTVARQALQFLP